MDILLTLINEVLEESGRDPVSSVDADTRLKENLGFDSLELAVLTVKIEAATGVDVFADGLVRTVGEIEQKIARAGG